MLGDREKAGAMALLRLMETDDLISLAKTVTNSMSSVGTAEDAVLTIVNYSSSAVELLKRRKLKKELLFNYLVSKQVHVDPQSAKMQMAQAVLKHWGMGNIDILELMEIGEDSPTNSQGAERGDNMAHHHQEPAFPIYQNQPGPSAENQNAAFMPLPNLIQDITGGHAIMNSVQPSMNIAPRQPMAMQQNITSYVGESWISDFMNFDQTVQPMDHDVQMGQEFAKWFYVMLNACHPQGLPCRTPFNEEHFFPECIFKVAIVNANNLEIHEGASAVVQKFMVLTQIDGLLFNANVDAGGIKGFATPHGLKIFLVCGTLHKAGDIVGVFAQQFGLVRNPDRNFNWNIKFTNLKLIAGKPTTTPTLDNPGQVIYPN